MCTCYLLVHTHASSGGMAASTNFLNTVVSYLSSGPTIDTATGARVAMAYVVTHCFQVSVPVCISGCTGVYIWVYQCVYLGAHRGCGLFYECVRPLAYYVVGSLMM
eukprot:Lankesteria_metandrocarpae@DN6385_c0_g1_i1.p1